MQNKFSIASSIISFILFTLSLWFIYAVEPKFLGFALINYIFITIVPFIISVFLSLMSLVKRENIIFSILSVAIIFSLLFTFFFASI